MEGWQNLIPAFQRIVPMKIVTVVLQQLHVPGRRLLGIPTNRVLVTGHYEESEVVFFCSFCYQVKTDVSASSFL